MVEDSPQLAAGIFNTGGNVGRLNSQFFVNVKYGLLPAIVSGVFDGYPTFQTIIMF